MNEALKTMVDNMPDKTGRSLEEWKKMLRAKHFVKHSEAVKFLKQEHEVTHGYANTIVALSNDKNETPDDLLKKQYEGKENLKPIYDQLVGVVGKFGTDVIITPKKSSVSIIRKRQFALIKPATKSRIDLGLKLVGKELTERLGNSGAFGTMCTHSVQLSNADQIDKELIGWLTEAYENAK